MTPPTPPKCIAEALLPYLYTGRHAEAATQAVWDALLAKGALCHLDRMADPRDDNNPMGIVGLAMTKRPADISLFRPVLVLPLEGLGGDPQTGNK